MTFYQLQIKHTFSKSKVLLVLCNQIVYYMEKALAPHSSTLAWKLAWTEDLVGCSPWGREESYLTE